MINVATIGTSWITEQFIKACKLTDLYHLKAVYSRSVETAKDFAQVYQADYYTDALNNILFDPEVDLVYIASPNAMHFSQALRAVKAGKHVIVEKPIVTSIAQWHELEEAANRNGVFFFEAAVHYQNRNYRRLKELVKGKLDEISQPFLGANFNIGQYSSRYVQYLAAMEKGEKGPNVFNPAMAGGALMDLGVYPLYVAIDLFGLPQSVRYNAQKGKNGVDLFGTIHLKYADFMVNTFLSKGVHSQLTSEIYVDDETIVIHGITRIDRVDLIDASGQEATLIAYTPENPMYDELVNFAEVINHPDDTHLSYVYEDWKQTSLAVTQTMELLRKSAKLSEIDEF